MSSRKRLGVDAPGPTIGAMMRIVHQDVVQKMGAWLATSPYRDIQPAHCAALQPLWKKPEGARLTSLAQTARITKQSMAALVEHLMATGYLERVADPDDGRAWRLRLTARGRAFGAEVRAFAQGVEAQWVKRAGQRRIDDLRATLAMIVAADD